MLLLLHRSELIYDPDLTYQLSLTLNRATGYVVWICIYKQEKEKRANRSQPNSLRSGQYNNCCLPA